MSTMNQPYAVDVVLAYCGLPHILRPVPRPPTPSYPRPVIRLPVPVRWPR